MLGGIWEVAFGRATSAEPVSDAVDVPGFYPGLVPGTGHEFPDDLAPVRWRGSGNVTTGPTAAVQFARTWEDVAARNDRA